MNLQTDRQQIGNFTCMYSMQLALRAVPYRKDFIKALKRDAEVGEETILSEMREHVSLLAANLDVICKFYIDKGQDSDKTV